jgi:beta-lactamase regulating signal transducer with metallopeptidase domain
MNLPNTFSAGGLVGWLADFYLLATLLLLVALAARRWIRQPVHRLTVAWIVGIELLALAVICALSTWPRISLVVAASPQAVADAPAADVSGPPMKPIRRPAFVDRKTVAVNESAVRDVVKPAGPPVPVQSPWTATGLIAAAFLAGAALMVVRLCWGAAAARWICRRAVPAPESLRAELADIVGGRAKGPRLLVSPTIGTAVALGILRPTILLSARLAAEGPREARRAVLAHEWAHVRNGDLWLLALGRWLLVVLYAHPLFWWLRRAVRNDQECLADAAAAGDHRPAYAEELLRWVRSGESGRTRAWAAVGLWENASQLSRRIAMLLDDKLQINPTVSRRWRCQAAGALILLGAALSLVTLQPGRSSAQQGAPAPAAKPESEAGGVGIGTLTVVGPSPDGDSAWTYDIDLPSYHWLANDAIRKELGLSAEQERKLRAISAKYRADREKEETEWVRPLQGLPPSKHIKAYEELRKKNEPKRIEHEKAVTKQVEEVLTRGQLKAYWDRMFPEAAYDMLFDPATLKLIAITPAQNKQLRQIGGQAAEHADRQRKEWTDKALAVLDSQQQAKLRAAIQRNEYFISEGRSPRFVGEATGGDRPWLMLPPAYDDLDQGQAREQRGIDAAQEKRLQAISTNYSREKFRLMDESYGLAPSERERRWPEIKRKFDEADNKAGLEIAAVLTPRQLAALKEIESRRAVDGAISLPEVQKTLGLSDAQKARLRQIEQERRRAEKAAERATIETLLAVLTAAQRQKLRAQLDTTADALDANPAEASAAPGSTPAPSPGKQARGDQRAKPILLLSDSFSYHLPAYLFLADLDLQEELQLSPGQKDRLLQIALRDDLEALRSADALRPQLEKMTAKERREKAEEAARKWAQLQERRAKIVRKQIEELLTARQLDAYKQRVFPFRAYSALHESETLESIAATPTQKEQLRQVCAAASRRAEQQGSQCIDKALAVLDAMQQAKLRAAIERNEGLDMPDLPDDGGTLVFSTSPRFYGFSGDVVVADRPAFMLPRSYGELMLGPTRERLGIDATQEKQLQAISTRYRAEAQRLSDDGLKLSKMTQEELNRNAPEYLRKQEEADTAASHEIDALLRPEQVAALKEINFRQGAKNALFSAIAQKRLGLSDAQKARLRQLDQQRQEGDKSALRGTIERSLAVLTAAQRQKLREEIDRKGW